jgi:hypothetical protein
MSNKLNVYQIVDSIIIMVFAILGMILLISNPGYFSHDELQKLDHIKKFGLLNYLETYISISQSGYFGVPIRPFAFFIQGIQALFMDSYPVLVHLSDVILHGLVAILLYIALIRFDFSRGVSLSASLVFSINPMCITAVGWSAALMDRWYVIFGFGAFLCAESYIRRKANKWLLGLIVFFMAAAILSKETALMLPGLLLIFVLTNSAVLKDRRFWLASLAMLVPVVMYLVYRLPKILVSFSNPITSTYQTAFENIPTNLLVYFAYPFVPNLTEAINWVFINPYLLYFGFFLHFSILIFLWLRYGLKFFFGYLYLYLLFLIPVLMLFSKSAHYLYASSLFTSVAIACLLNAYRFHSFLLKSYLIIILLIMIFHTLYLQFFVYQIGNCMNKAIISLEAIHISMMKPNLIEFRAEVGAPEHIIYRFATGRDVVGESYPIGMKIVKWGTAKNDRALNLTMDKQCHLYVSP